VSPLRRALLASIALFPALAWGAPGETPCDRLIQPNVLAQHSQHAWRRGAPIRLPNDLANCNYYQEEVPGGLSLAVRADPEGKEFRNAQEMHAGHALEELGERHRAFYFRVAGSAPFQPSWGIIVHARSKTYHLEGVPEAGDAEAARRMAREIVLRTMKRF
jgi:hypothetical protein